MFDATQKARLLRDAAECMAEADATSAAAAEAHRAKSEAQRLRMRDLLLQSYLHKPAADCACSMCGLKGKPLAFHVIEQSFDPDDRAIPYDKGFVRFMPSGVLPPLNYIRGCFPLCTACAPPCKKCELPTDPLLVQKFASSVQSRIGPGVCTEHIHWRYILEGLVARILRRH